jgi:hypothetical protein
MENNVYEIGQQDFNLPHDVVSLPSGGVFYKSKKKSIKVGYLTASDENLLASANSRKTVKETVVLPLLRSKVYERDLRPEELLEGDVEAILIFLRNTSFGPEYTVTLIDPKTEKPFTQTVMLDELNIRKPSTSPNEDGTFTLTLPRSGSTVRVKLLSLYDEMEIDRMLDEYPQGRVAPIVTWRLAKSIVDINGNDDRGEISKFSESMPIMDSKYIRAFLKENEPKLDLKKEVIAPSGEKVVANITFGVEFFRPFF